MNSCRMHPRPLSRQAEFIVQVEAPVQTEPCHDVLAYIPGMAVNCALRPMVSCLDPGTEVAVSVVKYPVIRGELRGQGIDAL